MTTKDDARTRRLISAAAVLTLVAFAALAGFMLRPALTHDDASSSTALNPVEVGFTQDMLAHHQQAVEMGRLIDRDGIDPRIRTIGRQIVQNQQFQMGTMSGWLRLNDDPLTNPEPMTWMTKFRRAGSNHDDDDTDGHTMPGMSTPDEVADLGTLPATEAENRFLLQMQRHHYGGIAMTQDLLAQVPTGVVAQLANDMMTEQTKETGLMGSMITERGISTEPTG